MTISRRNYFIVIDKDHESKKEYLYNINFFYLKSFKKKGFSFSYINTPFFRGNLLFGIDIKNKMRPLTFQKYQKDNTLTPINPRLFRDFLFAEENKFIAFSNQTPDVDYEAITKMLNNLQYNKENIKRLTFCKLCIDKNKFSLLDKNFQIISFNNQKICHECALEIILREIKSSGLFSGDKISLKIKDFFRHLILKFKNLKKVLYVFKPEFNPIGAKELTIYDVEKKIPVSKKYLNCKIDDLDIPISFKDLLKKSNLSKLLPIQAISVEKGLLSERINQLIMAPTSGGKTLVGELAGVSRVLNEKNAKMLYLVPIVALANIRTEEFKKKYKMLKLKIIEKVGESLLEKTESNNLEDLIDADIIIATYEAIDYILRSGKKEVLGKIGTIIIDEIQVLIDNDRGFLLDGFIARLKVLHRAQYLYLSATIGEPLLLADKLNCKLIQYNNRPVPIERHLLLCLNEIQKEKYILKLVRAAYSKKSQYGFKGQSIIFTNTRKKCEALTSNLKNKGILVSSYHSGLTSEERKVIEHKFQKQEIAGVVATAALAAGVDLPAQQVIFESLAMGINWLTVAEFEQMLGRAGRLRKHELGSTYLLVEPGKKYSPKMKLTEENIAIKLLNGKIKDFELTPSEDKSLTELLAYVTMYNEGIKEEQIYNFYTYLINNNYELKIFLKKLIALNLIRKKENFLHKPTRLGQAITKSFLTIEQCLEIIEVIKNKEKSIIDIALDLKSIRNVYLSKKIVADLAKNVNMRYFSNNFFSSSVLRLMNAEYVKKRKTFSDEFLGFITKWVEEIFNCKCKDNPYCECGRLNLERKIFSLRIEDKFSVKEISDFLEREYKIIIFKGDLISYLENLIYSLESVKNISESISNLDEKYQKEISKIPNKIDRIRNI